MVRSTGQLFGVATGSVTSSTSPPNFQIVILTWPIVSHAASQIPGLMPMIAHLREIETAYRIDTGDRIRFWQPSERDIRYFGLAIGTRAGANLRAV